MKRELLNKIYYVGVNDRQKTLFENMLPLPYGVSYNAYFIDDEKTVLVDLAAFREGASVHEVVLAADAGDDAGADRIGAYLACEVYLDCGVDGHYRRVLRDAERVIGPCDVLQEKVLTIVHIVIETAGTEGQRGH